MTIREIIYDAIQEAHSTYVFRDAQDGVKKRQQIYNDTISQLASVLADEEKLQELIGCKGSVLSENIAHRIAEWLKGECSLN